MRSDLHIHSKVSDGSMEPEEILRLASDRGLEAVAITDHDSDAAHKILIERGGPFPLVVIPGLELDVSFGGIIGEILIYGHRVGEGPLGKMLEGVEERRRRRAEIIWTSVRRGLGTELPPLDYLYPPPRRIVTRPQMANCLLDSDLAPHMEGAMDIVTAYDPGFDPPSASEAISAAKASGGLVVLAHPLQYEAVKLAELVEELVEAGLDGIEGSYPYSREEDIGRAHEIEALAADRHIFMTGGSDAHHPEEIGRCTVELPVSIRKRCLNS